MEAARLVETLSSMISASFAGSVNIEALRAGGTRRSGSHRRPA
jgi:hypothetical protein